MGLLDKPLVNEMDELERAARSGDKAAINMLVAQLPTIKRVHYLRLVRNEGKTPRQALEQVGILILKMGART